MSADAAMARRLQVGRKAPLLLRSHTVHDAGSRPIEFAEAHYVSSRFALTLDMKRGTARNHCERSRNQSGWTVPVYEARS